MKKHINAVQFSIFKKMKIEMRAVGIALTDHRSKMIETDSP